MMLNFEKLKMNFMALAGLFAISFLWIVYNSLVRLTNTKKDAAAIPNAYQYVVFNRLAELFLNPFLTKITLGKL